MAVVVETVSPLGEQVQYRQVISPNYLKGSFVIDDANNHDFKLDARGKSRMTVLVQNPGDQVLTAQVYGMHSLTATVGDVGVKQIGGDFTVGTVSNEYRTVGDPFPYYLVRVTPAASATNTPSCTVYVDFHS